jgi:hypothetical protein
LALMPSIYRGGADVPHPHSFFQFWFSGPEAAFNHHGDEGDEGHVHSSVHHAATVDSRCGALVGYDAFACPTAPSSSSSSESRDVARISPMVPPGGTVDVIVVTASALLIALVLASRRWRFPARYRVWLGVCFSPKAPPPRCPANHMVMVA